MATYLELLRDPRWQRKRLEILKRDGWSCVECGDSTTTLHVHHRFYVSRRLPWEYLDSAFQTLCVACHNAKDEELAEQREFCAANPEFAGSMFEDWEHLIDQGDYHNKPAPQQHQPDITEISK